MPVSTKSPSGRPTARGSCSTRTGRVNSTSTRSSPAAREWKSVLWPRISIKAPTSWSADGRFLLYHSVDPQTNEDLWVMPMTGERAPSLFLKTPFRETLGRILAGRSVGGVYVELERIGADGDLRTAIRGACGGRRRRQSVRRAEADLDGWRRLPAMAARRQGAVLSQRGGRDDGGDDHGQWSRRSHRACRRCFFTRISAPAAAIGHMTSPATAGS